MAKDSIRIVVVGATGRMGRSVVDAARAAPGCVVSAAIVSPTSPMKGTPVGEAAPSIRFQDQLEPALQGADVAIDFSSAAAVAANLPAYSRVAKPLLVGTTGLEEGTARALGRLAGRAPVMIAPNTSIGVSVLVQLVRRAAAMLPAEFDIEIVESHHKAKQDLPSGTALALGAAAASGRGLNLEVAKTIRSRPGRRQAGEIGFASIRGGDIVGKHVVLFAGAGEQLTLAHDATDRGIFAAGALRAANWLVQQPAGSYEMKDFIGL